MPQRVVGVSIEATAVKAAEVRSRFGKRVIERAGSIDLPHGAVDWGTIIDADAVAEALRELWKQAGFKTRNIVISLDGRSALIRETEIPVLSEQAYRQALRYDLAELVPYPADEAVIDYIELAVDEDESGMEQRRSIAIAVRKRSLERLRGVAAEAKLNVVRFDLPALALDRATRAASFSPDTTEPAPPAVSPPESGSSADQADTRAEAIGVEDAASAETATREGSAGDYRLRGEAEVLVHVESETTTVAIRNADGVQFVRTLTVGSLDEGTSLASELEAHLQTIYDHENLGDSTPTRPEPQSETRHPVGEGVKGTLAFIATLHPDLRITRVVASGGNANKISTILNGDDIGLPVTAPELELGWATGGDTNTSTYTGTGTGAETDDDVDYLVEVGAALTEVGSNDDTPLLELETDEERSSSVAKQQWTVGVTAAAVLAALLIVDGSGRWSTLDEARRDAEQAESSLAAAEATALNLAETQAVQAEYLQATALVEQALVDDLDLVGIVDALATGLPSDASLSSLSVRSGETFSLVPPDEDLGRPVGRVDLVGRSPGHIGVADWLRSFESVDNLDGEEISGSAIEFGEDGGTSSFSGSAVIVDAAAWYRGPVYGLAPLDDRAAPDDDTAPADDLADEDTPIPPEVGGP